MRRLTSVLMVGSLVAAVGAGVNAMMGDGYTVQVAMPSASNLVTGSPVQVNGSAVGTVRDIQARDGKAVLTLALSGAGVPLHDGSQVRIAWKAVLGERIVEIEPGARSNPAIPDGGLIEGTADRVEIDEVLAALDGPTRARLAALIRRLDETAGGSEEDLNQTLRTAGPTVRALGQVLQSVGSDGVAIRALVVRLNAMTGALADRQGDIRKIVEGLSRFASQTAGRQQQLREALRELPGTLDAADQTLSRVPRVTQATVPLLRDLRAATRRLPSVSRDLRPLLRDLRPAVADLKPTLGQAKTLLGETPQFLDGTHQVLPTMRQTLADTQDVGAFLRPYTPELAGWISNWGSATAGYDSYGHYSRIWVQGGPSNFNANPGVLPPGIHRELTPLPGELEGQPWTDAYGSEMR